ncbi:MULTISPECIES: hypothetical protein [Bizionia]|uniref:Magnesium citrate secondary transporter n=1 Tax=Bizionia algoritergicola TaxID=291187 RepID=A0A5D0R456_9FLAO|nr:MULTISPECIES: hypothetical protein [Bizionia]OBX24430.1 hypothetical protein BAA08_01155 [Bizionia sp. APA-3]TYB75354.1 hypothetical protein ES675_04300 [Bizionia algoritergicola]
MKILKHPIFFSSILVASFVYISQRLQVPLPNWIYFYLNDFLCMPIVLSLCLAIIRRLKKANNLYVPLLVVLGLTTYFVVYFEWFMPQISTRYTADIIDVGLYYLGAMLFFNVQKRLF